MPDEMKFQEMEAVIGELFEKLPVIDKEKRKKQVKNQRGQDKIQTITFRRIRTWKLK